MFKGADRASDAVEALNFNGYDWVFLDGPPGSLVITDDAIQVSDFVVIPMRASGLDLLASQDAVRLCQEAGVTYMVVLNACRNGVGKDKLVDSARSTLLAGDVPLAKSVISQRAAFVTAMTRGKTGAEKDEGAKAEIDNLWREIKAATLKVARQKRETE